MSAEAKQVFIHLSDLHLSDLGGVGFSQLLSKRLLGYLSWRRKRRREHSAAVLAALCADLGLLPANHLLVSGDLTHLGLPDEFSQVRRWLDQLAAAGDISVVPGNHDSYVAESWQNTYSRWLPYLRSDGAAEPASLLQAFPSLKVREGIAFIGLNSALPTPPFFATGKLGSAQLEKLSALLAETAARGLFRVVYLHHPPIPGQEKWRKRLCDAAALLDVIRRQGAELLLHGHSHRWQHEMLELPGGKAVPVIGIPSSSALGQHGEAALYNRYSLERVATGWTLQLESRRYQRDAGRFLSAGTESFAIPR
ncbi:metallophosphoesterase family protein [Porticoccus sp.]